MLKTSACLVCPLALALTVVACGRDDRPRRTEGTTGTSGTSDAAVTVRLPDLVAEPEKYFGKTVTVVDDVEEVLGPRAFALDDDSPLAGDGGHDLLVFTRNAADASEIDDRWLNNTVRVTGIVRRISVADVEREIRWDLDPKIEEHLERAGAVVIANSVRQVEK
jgi:hypothetical protein